MEMKESLKRRVELFKKENPVADKVKDRITAPSMPFFGEDILEKAVTAILEGENILLCGDKATGKMCLPRTWPGFSGDLSTMYPSM